MKTVTLCSENDDGGVGVLESINYGLLLDDKPRLPRPRECVPNCLLDNGWKHNITVQILTLFFPDIVDLGKFSLHSPWVNIIEEWTHTIENKTPTVHGTLKPRGNLKRVRFYRHPETFKVNIDCRVIDF